MKSVSYCNIFYIVGLLLFPAIVSASSCPRFTTGSTSCSSSIFSGSSLHASCSDDNVISVSGTVTVSKSFEGNEKVTLLPCLSGGLYCFSKYQQDVGDICGLLTNKNGDECGSTGTYYVDKEFAIPASAQQSSVVMGMITIKVLVDDEEACEQQATASTSYMMFGVASVGLVGGLLFVRRRQLRKRPRLVLVDGATDSFVEMKDIQGAMA